MKFESLEEAYRALAIYLQAFVGSRAWDMARCKMAIFQNMARGDQCFEYKGEVHESGGFEADDDAIWNGLDASIYIRNVMLENTGHRIWGLTFTLFSDGKFDIEFDYSKPSDYEESDETISGEEINQSLQELRPDSDKN
jgi:hypothetical protein